MGKHRVQSFYGFTTFVFLLYFTNASKTQNSQSVIDVMKADEKLQKFPPSFYKSNIAQNCSTVKYPETNVPANNISTNTFLCLAFYDACYKVLSNTNQMEILSNSKFDSYLHKFFPGEKDIDGYKFCTNLENVTISSKKLEPLLSQLVDLNKVYKCYRLCFTEAGVFNPLCAVIAWSKSIDKDAKMLTATQGMSLVDTSNTELKRKKIIDVPKSDTSTLKTMKINNGNNKDINDDEHNTAKFQSNLGNGMAKSSDSVAAMPPLAGLLSSQAAVSPESVLPPQSEVGSDAPNKSQKGPQSLVGSDAPNKSQKGEPNIVDNGGQKTKSRIDSSTVDQQQVVPGNAVVHASDNLHEVPKNPSTSNNGPDESAKEATDDTKTSTISENTQDDNSANQEDWSHGEPYDTNDVVNQPNDPAGDQTQNGLDLSGQRNIISHYHSMRPDEESHVFTYFTVITLVSIAAYIGYHNKQKILAIVLEGRRSRNSRGRRRPSTANYRKLDCTLEEAVTSQCNANVTHVIY